MTDLKKTTIHAKGYSVFREKQGMSVRFLAFITDFLFFFGILLALGHTLKGSPTLHPPGLVLFFILFFLYLSISKKLFHFTLGSWIWKLKFSFESVTSASLLTLALVIFFGWSLNEFVFKNPLYLKADLLEIGNQSFRSPEKNTTLKVLPFYYTFGMWPAYFLGEEVSFLFPYEKGPPLKFPGRFIAQWEKSEVTLRGPKTHTNFDLLFIKQCLLTNTLTAECMQQKESILLKHIQQMQNANPKYWKIHWFEKKGLQGIYLQAESATQVQERYLFLSPKGVEQAFTLDHPLTEKGQQAHELFSKSISSLKWEEQLQNGLLFINQEIANAKIANLKPSEIQMLLLSRISVAPQAFESYYHLAKIAYLLTQKGVSTARPLLHSAYLYAKDIAPIDTRTEEIGKLWEEARKR